MVVEAYSTQILKFGTASIQNWNKNHHVKTFRESVIIWKPLHCLCRLSETYIKGVGFLSISNWCSKMCLSSIFHLFCNINIMSSRAGSPDYRLFILVFLIYIMDFLQLFFPSILLGLKFINVFSYHWFLFIHPGSSRKPKVFWCFQVCGSRPMTWNGLIHSYPDSFKIFLQEENQVPNLFIVRTVVPVPPFLRHPPLDPVYPPLFKIFVSLPHFSIPTHPPFKVF